MATLLPPSSLQLANPFPRATASPKPHAPPPKFSTRATPDSDSTTPSSDLPAQPEADDAFEARLDRVRYRSGTGKKAELRKARKSKSKSASSASGGGSMYLPPVALKEPASAMGGTKVSLGFSPYSEKVNGLLATVGLTALVSVELATGKSVLSFHSPAILAIQIYFAFAVMTLFVKFEKESVSVWPQTDSSSSSKE